MEMQNSKFKMQNGQPPQARLSFCISHFAFCIRSPHRPSSLRRSVAPSLACSGFTLTELLVVIGIIIIVLGMTVAAFNQISGRRSIAMAQNQVAAYVSAARQKAMQGLSGDAEASCGVLFYRDPQTGRSAMHMVWRRVSGLGDPDPNDRYKGWVSGISYDAGDRVIATTLDREAIETGSGFIPRIMTKTYRCIQPHNSSNGNRPPASGPPFFNNYWEEAMPGNLSPVDGIDVQFLPMGVSAQVLNEPRGNAVPDRYLRTGVILFDRLGRLDVQPWSIAAES